jgi:hypothetical protein
MDDYKTQAITRVLTRNNPADRVTVLNAIERAYKTATIAAGSSDPYLSPRDIISNIPQPADYNYQFAESGSQSGVIIHGLIKFANGSEFAITIKIRIDSRGLHTDIILK